MAKSANSVSPGVSSDPTEASRAAAVDAPEIEDQRTTAEVNADNRNVPQVETRVVETEAGKPNKVETVLTSFDNNSSTYPGREEDLAKTDMRNFSHAYDVEQRALANGTQWPGMFGSAPDPRGEGDKPRDIPAPGTPEPA